jgi:phospholipid/cholesterol/gamma-HCH transport system permease protein
MASRAAASREPAANPYGGGLGGLLEGRAPYERLRHAGDMGRLSVQVVRTAVRPPFPWLRDAIVELSTYTRRCAVPLAISHCVYLIGFGILLLSQLIVNLGAPDRFPGAIYIIWSREISTWITAMIFAGIVGSAVTADLGARKIRDELDALAVLGVESVRTLAVPRVVAMTIAMPMLSVLSFTLVQIVDYLVAPGILGISHGVAFDNIRQNVLPSDLYLTLVLKNALLGFFIGIVSCYKGLTSPGGAEGVGRAVNHTVVICFFAAWLFNSLFNLAYLTTFPDVASLKG